MSSDMSPNFSEFSTSSTGRRKLIDRIFYMVCIAISILSVVILAVLLSSIVIQALPTIGPHSDSYESTNSRLAIVQGNNEGNNSEVVDAGDVIQGILEVTKLERGGLGSVNDEGIEDEDFKPLFGVFSFEVAEKIDENSMGIVFQLQPGSGKNNIKNILDSTNIKVTGDKLENATFALLSHPKTEVDFDSLKFDGHLIKEEKILGELSGSDWQVDLLLGQAIESDLVELKLQVQSTSEGSPSIDSMTSIGKVRNNKKVGQLNCIFSVIGGELAGEFEPIRIRSFVSNELVSGQAKIDAEYLTGLSRRKRRGFNVGGKINLVVCPIPEKDASAASHSVHFLNEIPKTEASSAGIGPAIAGSLWVIFFCVLFALPIGVATAIFLEEFKPTHKALLFLHSLIQLNISNLAGVPSIVYGILGLTAFASMTWLFGEEGKYNDNNPYIQIGASHFFQYLTEGEQAVLIPVDGPDDAPSLVNEMPAQTTDGTSIKLNILSDGDPYPEDIEVLGRTLFVDSDGGPVRRESWYYLQLPFGRGVLAASLTLMLVILPVIIISTQEALRAVPSSLREGALGLGSTPWQVVRKVTLPAAIPSIMTGAILSMSRAIGEAAPILILCGIVFITAGPQHLMDEYSVLPIQIYYWTKEPIDRVGLINFQNVAAAGIVVLLGVLLTFNAIAILIRQWTQKPLS